ncbi:DNA polymerase III subunit gamma and tau [Dermatophilus congolensis]|uniref:DNA polymerase III subunit gamma and tau n=1 Tax=Dermatophilus congolensis TaxID=1863 RepID=UPI001AAF9D69|nr:DNA polymerase III subunit gamma and tau [Dermatophilus congolensis]
MTQALYRRYRPETFSDVIGQEHVTEPLMNALKSGRVGHAYLFSGPRGCGKTTSARILARCLNCEKGPTPIPCGECSSCKALARGGAGNVDVIEIDAASHGGVDDARELREKASYEPANSRYRVYIIDEAHMVTPQGFNALLKIVEEPPEHVKFIFATTEPEKVIGTIRSRTHHYPFRLVPPMALQTYLEQVCTQEQIEVEQGVLSFVVRAGGGSVRDSMSVLDQLMAGSGGRITYAGAAALLGFTEGELLDATVDAIAAQDGGAVFRQIDRVIETGQDPRRFVEDLLERFRDLIVIAALNSTESASQETLSAVLRGMPVDQIARLREQATAFGTGELSYAADVVNEGLSAMTGATAPRLQLELLCARLLLPRSAGEDGVIARVGRLERRLELGGAPASARSETPSATTRPSGGSDDAQDVGALRSHAQEINAPHSADGPASAAVGDVVPTRPEPKMSVRQRGAGQTGKASLPQQAAPTSKNDESPQQGALAGVDTDAIRRAWPDVLAVIFGMRRATWTFLSQHSQVLDFDGQRLLLGINSRGLARTFVQGSHAEVVRQALIEARGVDVRVEGVAMEDRGEVTAAGSVRSRGVGRAGRTAQAASKRAPVNARGGGAQETVSRDAATVAAAHAVGARPDVSVRGDSRLEVRSRAAVEAAQPPKYPDDLPPEPVEYDEGPGDPFASGAHEWGSAAPVSSQRRDERFQFRSAECKPQVDETVHQVESVESNGQTGPHETSVIGPTSVVEEVAEETVPVPSGAGSLSASTSAPAVSGDGATRPHSGHEAFRAAMAARKAKSAGTGVGSFGASEISLEDEDSFESGASADDEDISDLSQVGQPVIAEILGGVVIAELDE